MNNQKYDYQNGILAGDRLGNLTLLGYLELFH